VSRRLQTVLRLATFAFIAAALATELRKPKHERRWHGRLAGVVPYEFRPPTLARIRERWWNPNDHRILTEHVFGVGWSVNLAQVLRILLR
jgi:hypothetical protein